MPINETIRKFFDDSVLMEWGRLERRPVEFAITSHYLKRYIVPGQRVLDIGGGPGRYSLLLAEMGCDVTLVDLSPANIAFALDKASERNLSLKAFVGDACEVDQLVSGPFDHVLNMGPLYHLLTEEARTQAITACHNLLADGGLVFASIITSHAGILYYLQNDLSFILQPGEEKYLQQLEQNLSYSGPAFTDAHFMRVGDLCPFIEKCGFETLHRISCEGITSPREKEIMQLSPEVQARWLALSLKLCERDEFMGFAEHVLYIGRK